MSQRVIEWDRQRLILAEGTQQGGRVVLSQLQVIPRESDEQDSHALIEQLKPWFANASEKSLEDAVVVVPRQAITIQRVQLPNLPDPELPDIVRMQAAMRLTVPIESVFMDFVPLTPFGAGETREMLIVTAPGELVQQIRNVLKRVHVNLSQILVSPFCIATSLRNSGQVQAAAPGTTDILAVLRRDFIELTFVQDNAVVYSHSGSSWSGSDGIEKTIRAELSKARLAAASALGSHQIGRLLLIGDPSVTSAISDSVAQRLDGAVIVRIDPSQSLFQATVPDEMSTAGVVTVAGAIASLTTKHADSIDLINPRKAPEKVDRRRVKILAGVLAGIVVIGGLWQWRSSQIQKYERQAAILKAEADEMNEVLRSEQGDRELTAAESKKKKKNRDLD
ncbi:MAG: pilus assembly protein PilM, partial [Planctomycetaceae bacterium]|nr:pilus assembly protein PilM [Planctomycetaceae bacterium]